MKTLSSKPDTLFPHCGTSFSQAGSIPTEKEQTLRYRACREYQRRKRGIQDRPGRPGHEKGRFPDRCVRRFADHQFRTGIATGGEKDNYRKQEYNYSSFTRSFQVPETVIASKIGAKYTDGILEITLPKKEESKQNPSVNIAVQ